jgi:hypothetical protein
MPRGRLSQGSEVIAEEVAIAWTRCDGQAAPWTGWVDAGRGRRA